MNGIHEKTFVKKITKFDFNENEFKFENIK